jgi:hypothetical protein
MSRYQVSRLASWDVRALTAECNSPEGWTGSTWRARRGASPSPMLLVYESRTDASHPTHPPPARLSSTLPGTTTGCGTRGWRAVPKSARDVVGPVEGLLERSDGGSGGVSRSLTGSSSPCHSSHDPSLCYQWREWTRRVEWATEYAMAAELVVVWPRPLRSFRRSLHSRHW